MEIRFGPTIRLPQDQCPVCKGPLDAATFIDGPKGKPGIGDFTCCICCGAILRWDTALRLTKTNDEDLRELLDRQPETFAKFAALIRAANACVIDRRSKKYRRN